MIMNILIVAIGSHGDVYPFVRIGTALKQKGHAVTVLSNNYFEEMVRSAGLDFAPVGSVEDYSKMVDEVDLRNPTRTTKAIMQRLYFPAIETVYNALAERNRPGKTVVIGITMAFGARIAQEKLGIPLITCHLAPISFPSVDRPAKMDGCWMPPWMPRAYKSAVWQLIDTVADMFLGPPINRVRSQLGLPPVKSIIRRWLHAPDKVIGLFPEWFAEPQPDWPPHSATTNFVCFDAADQKPMPPALVEFIAGGDPPIVFTAGTAVKRAAGFFSAAVDACERLNARGVLLARYKDQIPTDLPQYIHYCEYAPFSKLLPNASALVHHGGIGTCAQALRAGVPQLIIPFGLDQPDNASRIVNLGVGAMLRMKKCTGSAMADRLAALMARGDVHERCNVIGEELKRTDPVSDICRTIENFGREQLSIFNKN